MNEQDNFKKNILTIGKKIKGVGSLNFQMKKHKNKFYIFEINPRFSGTTSVRAFFGFNEPEMFIKSFFLKKEIRNCKYKIGMAYRYFEDIFVPGSVKKYKKQKKGRVSGNSYSANCKNKCQTLTSN